MKTNKEIKMKIDEFRLKAEIEAEKLVDKITEKLYKAATDNGVPGITYDFYNKYHVDLNWNEKLIELMMKIVMNKLNKLGYYATRMDYRTIIVRIDRAEYDPCSWDGIKDGLLGLFTNRPKLEYKVVNDWWGLSSGL